MTNILNYVLGGLVALLLIVCIVFWFDNNSMEKELLTKNASITTLTVQRDALQISADALSASIRSQNDSIKKLGDIQSSVDALFTGFNSSLTQTNKQIASIRESVSKEVTPTTCKDTIKYLKDARKEFK